MNRQSLLRIAGFALAALLAAAPAAAQKKTLAVVVKGLDNPFFTVLGDGCAKWNKENPNSEYTCLYTGPASSADEAGEVQIVEDLINKGVAGIAISPSNAPAMAKMLKDKKPTMPIMTIDADLAAADRSLRTTYLGTNNYDMGVLMARHLKELKPKGGSVCLQLGNVAADNINARAAGFRDTIAGKKGVAKLAGEGGWSEVAGCPLFTNDQIDLANQQMADVFTKNPKLDAFILVGGWAQFGPQAYAQVTDQVMPKLKTKDLIIVAGDTLPPQLDALKGGRSHAQIGQRPFEMGYRAPTVLIDLINKKKVTDPMYTGLDECTPANLGKCPAK
ncbi:sugar ABC transporter substrate-binding protein [Ramlibacter sp. G-1-2-2]|uniref:Sugar ABC transporter substrate-binding protein n=1 Tax=Ramlibacter agri TaxID=2728837 RepID=A0A848H591_9BURK|nr:substrate-binding domain-containing protein [Ramlibacter agri]NML45734.1 sugar ABC transporter substrate-binding protein [Ramlibacter agri]